jgi:formylglycine-generating enzyme required for sulfatase activity
MRSVWLAIATLSVILGRVAVAGPEEKTVQAGQAFRDCSDCPEMVVIPAGSFLMGSSAAETARDVEAVVPRNEFAYAKKEMASEQPQHSVNINQPFALGKYRVTRGEFASFVRETGYSAGTGCTLWIDHKYPVSPDAGWQNPGFPQTDRDPVVCVSWRDAKAYIAWLNAKFLGRIPAVGDGPYRLPSEAEWEYAARSGTRTSRWWGDLIEVGNANCDGCGSAWDKRQTSPSGSFQTNPFGLSDVLGNAWEWTEDCWNETYVGAPGDGSAWTSGVCDSHVMRGGSWTNRPWVLRSALRSDGTAYRRTNYIGFRVAKALR